MSKTQCLVGIENLKQDEIEKAGMLGMIPRDLWKKMLPAERVVLMRLVSKAVKAVMEQAGEIAATVIVKKDFMRDIEKVTQRLLEMLKWCRIQNLV